MTPDPPVASVEAAGYEIPTDGPEGDGTLGWSSTVMVVVHVRAGDAEGLGWTYAGGAAAQVVREKLAGAVEGTDPMDVPAANQAMLRECRNLGQPGVAACAISAVDMALWDLKARLLEVPLARLLGRTRPAVPVYGSGGFTTYPDERTRSQLEHWTAGLGIPRVKIKIAESWGSAERRDLHRVALARDVVGDDVELYVDANGGYGRKQAVRLGRTMSERWGVTWFEEPVSSDDLVGLREVRDQCPLDVAAGEYGYSPWYFAPMVSAGAVDCLQADATRCGGFTGWLAVAHLAAAHQLPISGHCAPNLHAQVAPCAPNLR
ncbi:MAG TPA: enolase C-terminal domain-like protein, partial [Acidimicrobiales bacterium]|nr:enolase C-terminal domain-like protein [Acidimicrobiales bacterium]